MGRTYKTKQLFLKNSDLSKDGKLFQFECFRESKELESIRTFLLKNIDQIIEENWGKFGKDFILQHIIKAKRLQLVRYNNKIIAIASASKKTINKKHVLYLEFTVINQNFQGYDLSIILNADMIVDEFVESMIQRKFKSLHVMAITRNLRVLGSLKHFASFIYPDPESIDNDNKLPLANNETWELARTILKQSWNPNRKLLREGCVLIGSYENTPWLISPVPQKHYNQQIQTLGEEFLELKKNKDKEFIVHVKYNILSILKYLVWFFKKKNAK